MAHLWLREPITGRWPFGKKFPPRVRWRDRPFREAQFQVPWGGAVRYYREPKSRNSLHLSVLDTGRYTIDHADEYNPDAGERPAHWVHDILLDPGGVRLWLDDNRPAPPGWTWAKSVAEAKRVLSQFRVVAASLDHDLGLFQPTGFDLLRWMVKEKIWPARVTVHSANPAGRLRMGRLLSRYHPSKP